MDAAWTKLQESVQIALEPAGEARFFLVSAALLFLFRYTQMGLVKVCYLGTWLVLQAGRAAVKQPVHERVQEVD